MNNKKQIALRLRPQIIDRLDAIRPYSSFHTRTDMIETACVLYLEYLEESLEQENLNRKKFIKEYKLEEIPL